MIGHKHSQHSYTNIHNTHNKSQFITQSWDAIIQTHKTSQYSQKITGGSQKITPIYIYIYIYTHSNRKKFMAHKESHRLTHSSTQHRIEKNSIHSHHHKKKKI